MRSIQVAFDFRQPPDVVFTRPTDFERITDRRTLDEMRVEPTGPVDVGSRPFSTVRALGRRMRFVNEVTEVDPGAGRYADRAVSGTLLIESPWLLEPNEGYRPTWTTRSEGGTIQP